MSLETFPRSNRLISASDYQAVFERNDYRITSGPLLLLARHNNLSRSRMGLVVGKKAVPLAVQRNRIKRVIRESFRLNRHSLDGTDIVILARKGLVSMDKQSLRNKTESLWNLLAVEISEIEIKRASQVT